MELGAAGEQLERVNKNGAALAERTKSPHEKDLVQSTCTSVSEQMAHVRHIMEQKKMAVSRLLAGNTSVNCFRVHSL